MWLRLTVILFFIPALLFAQAEHRQAFPITDYIIKEGDSIVIVQVELPPDVRIAERTVGLLQPKWSKEDSSKLEALGYGRCYLIKGNYYYFGMNRAAGMRYPKAGDLVYTKAEFPALYTGLLQQVYSHAVTFQNVYGDPVFSRDSIWHHNNEKQERIFQQRLVDEIRFVGKAMQDQQDQQDQKVAEGPYAGKTLFTLMANEVTVNDLQLFLKYIIARPSKYAGTEWSISEVFATWVVSGAPTVVD